MRIDDQDKNKRLHRNLSRKKKFSKNWGKARRKLNCHYRHLANKRKDALHKSSTILAKNHSLIVMEGLKVKQMTKSAKGTLENPGTNVSAKRGLNRSILAMAWSLFAQMLKYKMEWYGGKLLFIDPKYTSQRCSCCGYTSRSNRLTQSKFVCGQCGHHENADFNASKNILAEGHSVLACGESALAFSTKQELRVRKSLAI